ncbi:oocyte-expressed protein homolog isoform X1 [Mirounga leonina]|uniref:oocyte-expressed protein homolog isoform X1 n=1 Tax=Mirounga leonina TaxID=9715 RepID=UPI00156C4D72|nr:oocyte-expressed protein homolog isoform X1 [Mirounga leonina]
MTPLQSKRRETPQSNSQQSLPICRPPLTPRCPPSSSSLLRPKFPSNLAPTHLRPCFPSESLFSCLGPDRAIIPEMEWMSQVLLTVDIVNSGDLVEITIFGRPRVQNRVKSVLLSLASWHQKHRARAEKMKQLEEFLKAGASGPQAPQHPVA